MVLLGDGGEKVAEGDANTIVMAILGKLTVDELEDIELEIERMVYDQMRKSLIPFRGPGSKP